MISMRRDLSMHALRNCHCKNVFSKLESWYCTVGNVVDDGIQVRTHKDNFSPNSSSRLLPRLNYCNGRRVRFCAVQR